MITVEKGCFGYKKNELILQDITFSLESGRVMSILGPNGIGKTTLLKCLMGIFKWDSGRTILDGKVLNSTLDSKKIGYVPQAHPVAFSYSVQELVTMGRAKYVRMFGVPSREDKNQAMMAMKEVGIADIALKSCNQLSGGQLQLAFIARALAAEPEVLIMDEPESHLDFKNQFLILNLIEKLVKEKGISCILNTHYPEHALRISDKTLLMGAQKYLFGNTEEIITQEHMREFFGIDSRIIDLEDGLYRSKAFVITGCPEN